MKTLLRLIACLGKEDLQLLQVLQCQSYKSVFSRIMFGVHRSFFSSIKKFSCQNLLETSLNSSAFCRSFLRKSVSILKHAMTFTKSNSVLIVCSPPQQCVRARGSPREFLNTSIQFPLMHFHKL